MNEHGKVPTVDMTTDEGCERILRWGAGDNTRIADNLVGLYRCKRRSAPPETAYALTLTDFYGLLMGWEGAANG